MLGLSTGPAFAAADLPLAERLVVEGTNTFRAQEGAAPVQRHAQLEEAAQRFADFMARTTKYGHEADGRTPTQRAQAAGYEYCLVSENISYQFSSRDFATPELARRLVEGWKNSPGHRKNMLDRSVTHTGVAVAQSAVNGYYYAVQMFGQPRSVAFAFEVHNETGRPATYRLGDRAHSLAPNQGRRHVQCAREPLSFDLPGEDERFTPAEGDRFVLERVRGRVVVTRGR